MSTPHNKLALSGIIKDGEASSRWLTRRGTMCRKISHGFLGYSALTEPTKHLLRAYQILDSLLQVTQGMLSVCRMYPCSSMPCGPQPWKCHSGQGVPVQGVSSRTSEGRLRVPSVRGPKLIRGGIRVRYLGNGTPI